MDRRAFLSSLPFLLPSRLPPPDSFSTSRLRPPLQQQQQQQPKKRPGNPASTTTKDDKDNSTAAAAAAAATNVPVLVDRRCEVLLKDHYLSIEIETPTATTSTGGDGDNRKETATKPGEEKPPPPRYTPLFFAVQSQQQPHCARDHSNGNTTSSPAVARDPAMCPLEMILDIKEFNTNGNPGGYATPCSTPNHASKTATSTTTLVGDNRLHLNSSSSSNTSGASHNLLAGGDMTNTTPHGSKDMDAERTTSNSPTLTTTSLYFGMNSNNNNNNTNDVNGFRLVDWSCLENVQVERRLPDDTDYNNKMPSCCLLLYFNSSSVRFRIFSTSSPSLRGISDADAYFTMQSIQARLLNILKEQRQQQQHQLQQHQQQPGGGMTMMSMVLAGMEPATASPATTNASSSSSHPSSSSGISSRQEERQPSRGTDKHESKPAMMPSSPCPSPADDRTNHTTRLDRKRQAWGQCHANVDTLDMLLDMPVRAHTNSPESAAFAARVWLDHLAPILTGTAQELSRSYLDISDYYHAEHHTTQSQAHSTSVAAATAAATATTANAASSLASNTNVQEHLEQLLNDLIPVTTRPHRHKRSKTSTSGRSSRGRNSSGSATTTPITANQQHQQQQQQLSREETIAKVQELLHQQKESIQERHQLLLLPHRG